MLAPIRFAFLPIVIDLLGASAASVLAEAGLTTTTRSGPARAFESLLELATARTSPSFVLDVAQAAPRGALGSLEFSLRTAATMADALRALDRFGAALRTSSAYSVTFAAAGALLHHHPERGGLGPRLDELALAYALRLGRDVVGDRWVPDDLWLSHTDRSRSALLARRFGREPRYGAETSGFAVPRSVLHRSLVEADAAMHAWFVGTLERFVRKCAATNLTQWVRSEIARRLATGTTIDAIASSRGMSSRALQRALHEEGTSVSDIVAEVRKAVALSTLRRRDLSVREVAGMLGYGHPRAFDRAFRSWTGTSPSAWRKRAWRDEVEHEHNAG